jgi:hypothetical protein
MKTTVTLALALAGACLAAPAAAQTVGGGIKIGGSLADVSLSGDEEDEEVSSKGGLVVGGYLTAAVNDRFAFQPEVLYAQKGGSVDGEDASINLSFVQIPTLLRVDFPTGGTARPYLVAGPAFGFRTGASIEFEGEEEDISDEVARMEVSGIVGAGVQLGRAVVEARYDHGFRDLDQEEGGDGDAKSRTFSVLVGIGFGR